MTTDDIERDEKMKALVDDMLATTRAELNRIESRIESLEREREELEAALDGELGRELE